MKKILIFFLVFSGILFAGEIKIGYIDSNRILAEYKGTKDLEDQYNKIINAWQKKADNMKQSILDLQSELQSQSLLLSDEAKMRKMQELQNKQQEYEQFLQDIWGPNGKAKQKNGEVMKPLIEKINTILQQIGKDKGYTIIFDIAGGSVVYTQEGLDLTDEVLKELNKEFAPIEEVPGKKIKFYVCKFIEEGSEALAQNYGDRIKNLTTVAIKNAGNFEEIEPYKITDAFNAEGILRMEDITEEKAKSIIQKVNGNFLVCGKVTKKGDKITVDFDVYTANKGKIYTNTDYVVGESNLDKLVSQIGSEVTSRFKK